MYFICIQFESATEHPRVLIKWLLVEGCNEPVLLQQSSRPILGGEDEYNAVFIGKKENQDSECLGLEVREGRRTPFGGGPRLPWLQLWFWPGQEGGGKAGLLLCFHHNCERQELPLALTRAIAKFPTLGLQNSQECLSQRAP